MKIIDKTQWKRKVTYENFIRYTNPIFSIGTRVDVTELLAFCKAQNKNFFASFLYFMMGSINAVEEMRYRISGDDVVLYDHVRPSYIVALENEELVTCTSEAAGDFETFYANVQNDIASACAKNEAEFNANTVLDCVFMSCLPWTDFTSVSNPYDYADASVTSIPRITWGKFVKNSAGRYEMAIDIAAHHALIDGRQVSRVYENLSEALLAPEKHIRGDF